MAIEIAVTNQDPGYIDIDLDGRTYGIKTYWSVREQCWYFDLRLAADRAPLLMGKKVSPNIDLLHTLVDERLPPGVLMALDQSSTGLPPERDDLGERVALTYLTQAEVEAEL